MNSGPFATVKIFWRTDNHLISGRLILNEQLITTVSVMFESYVYGFGSMRNQLIRNWFHLRIAGHAVCIYHIAQEKLLDDGRSTVYLGFILWFRRFVEQDILNDATVTGSPQVSCNGE